MRGDREPSCHYQKGCLSDCNNWRGITLLSVPGKIFCTVILNRMNSEIDRHPREEQAGFRNGRSATNRSLPFGIFLNSARSSKSPSQLSSSISKRPLTVYTASQSGRSLDFMAFSTRSSIYSYLCTPTADAVSKPKTATRTCSTSLQVSDKAASFLHSCS